MPWIKKRAETPEPYLDQEAIELPSPPRDHFPLEDSDQQTEDMSMPSLRSHGADERSSHNSELVEKLKAIVQNWRKESTDHNKWAMTGYPEKSAADSAHADTYERCADELEEILNSDLKNMDE